MILSSTAGVVSIPGLSIGALMVANTYIHICIDRLIEQMYR